VKASDEAIDEIIRMASGDARKSLTILEAAAGAVTGDRERKKGARKPIITPEVVGKVMDAATVRYDKKGDDHYDVISAFIKSMRGSDPDAALHYLARMLRAGEDPRFIARRIMIASAEEVGMAAPQILQVTVAAAQAVAMIGMPEARIILSEATIAVATAPKSNASYNAINAALADVDAGLIGQVPLHLRNAPTKLMKSWGNHEGYQYAHDAPGAVAAQQYMPDELVGHEYYHPNERGYEHELGPRLERIRSILHGGGNTTGSRDGNQGTAASDSREA
jgi:putative ATPase